MSDTIRLKTSGGVSVITLNRPDKMNAFAGTMREELLSAVESVSADLRTRVLVVTGAGRAFCAGGDLEFMAALKSRNAPFREMRHNMDLGRRIVTALRALERPVIAAVNGVATGAGLSLALACDLRIASEAASLGATFSRVGLHPDWGASWFLPRLVGTSRALRMAWTGAMISPAEALAIGLVDQVTPAADHMTTVMEMAGKLAESSPVSLEWIKRSIYQGAECDLTTMFAHEMEAQEACWQSPESTEGITAFREKRRPRFTTPHQPGS
jgi:2-(1,2-epoxy-1,2-dihydrophenyl)acetyl-CoA isomerase